MLRRHGTWNRAGRVQHVRHDPLVFHQVVSYVFVCCVIATRGGRARDARVVHNED